MKKIIFSLIFIGAVNLGFSTEGQQNPEQSPEITQLIQELCSKDNSLGSLMSGYINISLKNPAEAIENFKQAKFFFSENDFFMFFILFGETIAYDNLGSTYKKESLKNLISLINDLDEEFDDDDDEEFDDDDEEFELLLFKTVATLLRNYASFSSSDDIRISLCSIIDSIEKGLL
jgi:hypothetical protein